MNPDFSLRDYQAKHCGYHIARRASLNYSACATGKTYTMAWLAEFYWKNERCKTVLINPISLSKKNKDEFLRFTDFYETEIQIVSGTPKQRKEQFANQDAKVFIIGPDCFGKEWENLPRDVRSIFVDESHLAYSGHKSSRTQSFYKAQKNADHVTFFTATPIASGRLDAAYPLFAVCDPLVYGNYKRFINYHAVYNSLGYLVGWRHADVLGKNLKRFSVGISFEKAYPDASKNIISFETCDFEDSELQRLYFEMEEQGLAELEDKYIESPNSAVTLMRCRQLLACPEALGYSPKIRSKDELLKSHLQRIIDGSERQILVFSAFVKEQERVVEICREMGLSSALINGSVVGAARARISEDFSKGRTQVLVASPLTMSVGHNFEAVSSIVFLTSDFGIDSFHQACFRGNRGSRKEALPIYILVYNCKVEKRFWKKVLGQKEEYKKIVESKLFD